MRLLRLVFVSTHVVWRFDGKRSAPDQAPTDRTIERDSAKDQAVVYIFILLTIGLLVYAAVRPYIEKRMDVSLIRVLEPTSGQC